MNQNDYFSIFKASINLQGLKVLEVGGAVPPSEVGPSNVSLWMSININDGYESKERTPLWYRKARMSVTNMAEFRDGTFDAVFSSNCFEHVDDIPAAFREIYRVLKPGGLLFTIFGPIWSGPVGHHTWIFGEDGNPMTFNDDLFPPWSHLRKTRAELAELLRWKYSPVIVDRIVKYVYDSKDVNRNPDTVYENEAARYQFVPVLRLRIRTKHRLTRSMECDLRWKHPEVADFRTSGFFWVLAKGGYSPIQSLRVWVGAAWVIFMKKLFP